LTIDVLEEDLRPWNEEFALEAGLPEGDKEKWASSRNIDEVERLRRLKNIVKHHAYDYIDGLMVDAVTAGWVLQLYEALQKEENKKKYVSYDFAVMVDIMYKLNKKGVVKLGFK
jgi:hypothetical protein